MSKPAASSGSSTADGLWRSSPSSPTGGYRYQDLYDGLDGISYKMLTETLRRAERDGLITRHLDGERIETATLYELTDLGRSLDAPLASIAEWADRNWQSVEAARQHWDRLRRSSR